MSFKKFVGLAMFGLIIAFSGMTSASAQSQPVRSSAEIIVDDDSGPVATMHTATRGTWNDVVSMYDKPVVILACRDSNPAVCATAKATLTDLAAFEGDQKWAFVVLTNGLTDEGIASAVVVLGDNPVWVELSTYPIGKTPAQVHAIVEHYIADLSSARNWRHTHCQAPAYFPCQE